MNIILAIALLIIAVGYSAAGLGGGTGYLAVLTFWSNDLNVIRPMSWGLQILVAGVGFLNFYRAGHFSLVFAAPLILGGTMGGAIGDRLPISGAAFDSLLAVILILVSLKMFIGSKRKEASAPVRRIPWIIRFIIGLAIGVFTGLLGSGGGVILGPVIMLLRLADIKRSAATTSIFVLLTSAGAMGTHVLNGGQIELVRTAMYGSICIVGAYFGSMYGARKASARFLEVGFGAILLIAGARLAVGAI